MKTPDAYDAIIRAMEPEAAAQFLADLCRQKDRLFQTAMVKIRGDKPTKEVMPYGNERVSASVSHTQD